MRFVYPEVCWFLLLLPLLLTLVGVEWRRRAQFVRCLGNPGLLQPTRGPWPGLQRAWVRLLLVGVPFVCTLLALADPRAPYGAPQLRAGALDVVMVVDVS